MFIRYLKNVNNLTLNLTYIINQNSLGLNKNKEKLTIVGWVIKILIFCL